MGDLQVERVREAVRMKRLSLSNPNPDLRLTWAAKGSQRVHTQFFFEICLLLDHGDEYNWTTGYAQLEDHIFYFSKESNSRASLSRKQITSLDSVSCMNSDKTASWIDGSGVYLKLVAEGSEDLKPRSLYIRFVNKTDLCNFLKLLSKEAIVHNVFGYLMSNNMEGWLSFDSRSVDVHGLGIDRRRSLMRNSIKLKVLSDDEILLPARDDSIELADGADIPSEHEPSAPLDEKYIEDIFFMTVNDLSITGKDLNLSHLKLISSKLCDNTVIKNVDLSNNPIGPDGALFLQEVLCRNNVITSLNLSDCHLGDEGVERLSDALYKHSVLEELILVNNNIQSHGAECLARCALASPYLVKLSLAKNGIGTKGACALADVIGARDETDVYVSSLTYLDLNRQTKGKKIYSFGASELARALRNANCRITTLKIGRNNIYFEGIRHISASLYVNTTLTDLDVGGIQYFNIAGAMHLAQAIENNQHLKYVTCGDFRIPVFDVKGAHLISDFSTSIKPKTYLEISDEGSFTRNYGNDPSEEIKILNLAMQDEMAIVLGYLLKRNKCLETLCIKADHPFDKTHDCHELRIQELIGNNLEDIVISLDLSNRGYRSIHAIIIGLLIQNNDHLKELKIRGNNFADSEGENFLAFALRHNTEIKLTEWSASIMYAEHYRALASIMGFSASGAIIEPQRLEGAFYRTLTALSACMFYFGIFADINAIYQMANDPTFPQAYWKISIVFLVMPTILVSFNILRSMILVDPINALKEVFVVVFQLSSYFQARYSVIHSVETSDMLDYKFTQGVYRQLPGIAFQTYILLYMCRNEGFFSFSILVAIFASLIGLVVIFIMRYDRIEARRMSFLPLKLQPTCAVIIAAAYSCCGMGVDNDNVYGLVNFDAFYTSHYTWAYVNQLLSLVPRMVSVTWLMASLKTSSVGIIFAGLFTSRLIWIYLFDSDAFSRPLPTNLINALSLLISDSAWVHQLHRRSRHERAQERVEKEREGRLDEVDEDQIETNLWYFVKEAYKTFWLQVMILTTIENVVFLYMSAFQLNIDTNMSYYDASCLFTGMMVLIFTRWFFIIHWAFPTHFHKTNAVDDAIEDILIKWKERSLKLKKYTNVGDGFSPRRRNLIKTGTIYRGKSPELNENKRISTSGDLLNFFGIFAGDSGGRRSPSSMKADVELGGIDVN